MTYPYVAIYKNFDFRYHFSLSGSFSTRNYTLYNSPENSLGIEAKLIRNQDSSYRDFMRGYVFHLMKRNSFSFLIFSFTRKTISL